MGWEQSARSNGYWHRPQSYPSVSDLPGKSDRRSRLSDHDPPAQDTLSDDGEQQSSDPFDRICSLLSHLIVDASTAVGTQNAGTGKDGAAREGTPNFTPMVYADSESSEESQAEEEQEETGRALDDKYALDPTDGRDIRKWDSRAFRTRTRSYLNESSLKRRSLFLELQSCQPDEEQDTPEEIQATEVDMIDGSTRLHSTKSSSSYADISIFSADDTAAGLDGGLLHPPSFKGLRRCASFPSMKSEIIEQQHAKELEQVIQCMDSELDRTAEAVDSLTRDLETVATHHNWMQLKLESALESQAFHQERIERAHGSRPSSSVRSSVLTDTTAVSRGDFAADFDDSEDDTSFWTEERFMRGVLSMPSRESIAMAISSASYDDALLQDRTLSTFDDSETALYSDMDDLSEAEFSHPQWNSGSTEVPSRISVSSDRTLEIRPDTFLGFDHDDDSDFVKASGVTSTSLPFSAPSIGRRHQSTLSYSDAQMTPTSSRRWQYRSSMPAAWPTATSDVLDADSQRDEEDADNLEDPAIVANLSSTVVCLSALLFWTTLFVLATLTAVPSLVATSRSKATKAMEDAQNRLAGSLQDMEADLTELSTACDSLTGYKNASESRADLRRRGQHTADCKGNKRPGFRRRQRNRMSSSKRSIQSTHFVAVA
ncbi:hypothetical protein BGZ98_002930 [Dissophora globulifera]|nr:hypothetical protein BGZ98_002930 [Dissophora globulifera]